MTDPLTTAEDVLRATVDELGIDPARVEWDGQHPCGGCGRVRPYFALALDEARQLLICGDCRTNDRIAVPLIVVDAWDSERGNDVRARRDQLLNRCMWTVLPGSPLSTACKSAWAEYRAALNRVSIDFACPSAVIWPEPPSLEFASNPEGTSP